MKSRLQSHMIVGLGLLLICVALGGCQVGRVIPLTPPSPPVGASPSVETPAVVHASVAPPTSTATRSATPALTATRSAPPASGATRSPDLLVVRAKVEIVWPHGGADVQEADRANITAYLLAGDGTAGPRSLLDPPPCDWNPTVRLWAALNSQPSQQIGVGQKRMVATGGRIYPAWDFNDVDVKASRDPANKLAFFVTVDGVHTLSNVWAHAADARTLFPQQDTPVGVTRSRPAAVDARIQIVWPKDGLPVQTAQAANVTAYLFNAGAMQAIAPDPLWSPAVRLHWSLNNEAEAAPGQGVLGVPRVVNGANGVRFLAWDFNDVDVSAANDSLNRLYFWVSVDGVTTYSNVWAHGIDARTLFPQLDVLNSCK